MTQERGIVRRGNLIDRRGAPLPFLTPTDERRHPRQGEWYVCDPPPGIQAMRNQPLNMAFQTDRETVIWSWPSKHYIICAFVDPIHEAFKMDVAGL